MTNASQSVHRFETVLSIQSCSLQQGDINEFTARGLDQFLVGKTPKHVSGRNRILREEEVGALVICLGATRGP